MILGIIFDFDNTIYDYDYCNKIALNTLFSEISSNFNKDINIIKTNYEYLNKSIKISNNTSSKFNKIIYIKNLFEYLNISLNELDKYLKIYNNSFNNNLKLYDGIEELLKLFKKNNIKIGLLSNNNFNQQYEKLKILNILEYFDVIQTSDECGEEKPHINMYLNIQNKLNIPFENIGYIGDNYDHDILPSLNLKILPFYYIKDFSNLLLHENYIKFGNFIDLLNFFEKYFITVNELIFLSKYFGQSNLNIQGPGGNISIKLDEIIFIKSSGAVLGNLSYNEGYCLANNTKCLELLKSNKELELKNTKIFGYKIPSMETFFHAFMKKYTVHIHFTLSNIYFCSNKDFQLNNFPYNYEIIKYIPPGLLLADEVYKKYSSKCDIYFLENHGIIITNHNLQSIIEIYKNIYNYFNNLLDNKFNDEYNTFLINENYYFKKNKSLIIRYIDYQYKILEKIKYCFPDLAIFIEKIKIFDNLEELYEILDNYNIIILNKKIYLCGDTLTKIYYLVELLDKYKILCDYSYENLNKINDTKYLQNMEQEKFRKL
jgi:HAD superfamily hydrolase (TIGR01549 family)